MSETERKTIVLAGRVLGYTPPTQGQIEALIRISRAIMRGAEDDQHEFWMTQIERVGTLLESLIDEGDRYALDQLYLTGKISTADIITAVMGQVDEDNKAEGKAKPVKANTARVRRN